MSQPSTRHTHQYASVEVGQARYWHEGEGDCAGHATLRTAHTHVPVNHHLAHTQVRVGVLKNELQREARSRLVGLCAQHQQLQNDS
jgi:hypothetical protein